MHLIRSKLRSIRLAGSLAIYLAATQSWANEALRPYRAEQIPNTIAEDFVFVPGSEVAWADYRALRRDFPELRHLNNSEINAWIIEHYAFISQGQHELLDLRNTPIESTTKKTVYRPPVYDRASVNEGVDIKGSGLPVPKAFEQKVSALGELLSGDRPPSEILNALRTQDHSDGLMSLGEAIAEVTRQNAIQKLFDLENKKPANTRARSLQTVESYFIISLPFKIYKENSQSLAAALYGRQLHWNRGGRVSAPNDIYSDNLGGFQATKHNSAIDFGGARVTNPRLENNFSETDGGDSQNIQTSKPWAWGHRVAEAFMNGDHQAVFRHLSEMLAPIDEAWSKLSLAKRLKLFDMAWPRPSRLNMESRLGRKNFIHLKKLLSSSDVVSRIEGAMALQIYVGPKADELFAQAFSDSDEYVRRYATNSFQNYAGPRAEEFFLKILAGNPDQRGYAAKALKNYKGPKAGEMLSKVLSDEDVLVRQFSAQSLGGYSGFDAAKLFAKALADGDDDVRAQAAKSLHTHTGPHRNEFLAKALKDVYSRTRDGAARALKGSDTQTSQLFRKALADMNEEVRSGAAFALKNYSGTDASELFSSALSDASAYVRGNAILALENYRGADAHKLFLTAFTDKDRFARKHAKLTLKNYAPEHADEFFLTLIKESTHPEIIKICAARLLLSKTSPSAEQIRKTIGPRDEPIIQRFLVFLDYKKDCAFRFSGLANK